MDGDGELEELRHQRDRALAISDAIGARYLISKNGRVIEANDALCRLLGFDREELIGVDLPWPFWPPETRAASYRIRNQILKHERSGLAARTFEVPLMHKDGTRFTGEVTVARARMPDGAVLGWVNTVRDISERRDHEVELERLATHDPLTGLANRRLFDERLDSEIADAIRHQRPLAVAILDLDHFKLVNDHHGHPVGDEVLRGVAERLNGVLRRGDLLARLGGEEFGLILPEIFAEGALAAAERARLAVAAATFALGDGDPASGIELTTSVGVALRGDIHKPALLYEHADQALYRAKREGRNRTVVWDSAGIGSLG